MDATCAARGVRGRRLLALGLGIGVALALGEVAARAVAWRHHQLVRRHWARLVDQEPPAADGGAATAATLGQLMRASDDDRIVYELIPNQRRTFMGRDCAINALGFRDGAWPQAERSPSTWRIVGLGDSVLFGWGVDTEERYGERLQALLAAARPELRVEFLNTGVPGYNTTMEVAAFEARALAWQPDLVLVDWVGNDADLPNLIAREDPRFDLSRSYLRQLVGAWRGFETGFYDGPLGGVPLDQGARVPRRYHDMVGERGVRSALERLATLGAERGFAIVLCTHYTAAPFVQRACEELGIAVIEHAARVHEVVGSTPYRASPLILGRDDPHPSATGHALYAETLASALAPLAPDVSAAGAISR
jgi:lysophospholipase L1-like esterase